MSEPPEGPVSAVGGRTEADVVEIVRSCVEASIGRVQSIHRLSGGVMNAAFEVATTSGPPVIVRVAMRGRPHFKAEYEALHALADCDVPVPRVLSLDHIGRDDTVSVIALSKLPGGAMGALEHIHDGTTDATIVELGHLLARVHAATLDEAGDEHAGWLDGQLGDMRWMHEGAALAGIDQALVRTAAELVRSTPRPCGRRALIHNDFKSGNILIDAGRVSGIIDFEFSSRDDPARDIAFWTFWHGDRAGALLRAGYEASDIAAGDLDVRVALYRLEIGLSYLQWFRTRGTWPGAGELVTTNLAGASAALR